MKAARKVSGSCGPVVPSPSQSQLARTESQYQRRQFLDALEYYPAVVSELDRFTDAPIRDR
jgi:hypothetical protein